MVLDVLLEVTILSAQKDLPLYILCFTLASQRLAALPPLQVPSRQSMLVQDGFKSGLFYNRTDGGVDMGTLSLVMFAQMRTLDRSMYHIWAAFEDGAFLGYYDWGVNGNCGTECHGFDPHAISLSRQTGPNSSCPYYNYTHEQWDSALVERADQYTNISGLTPVVDPSGLQRGNSSSLTSYCREFHTVDRHTGMAARSFYGQPYDGRRQAWYWNVKKTVETQVSSIYVDTKLGEPAMAVCVPLVNTTLSRASQTRQGRDEHGMAGVACCGMLLTELSNALEDVNSVEASSEITSNASDFVIFIVERSSGDLVATSTGEDDYFDFVSNTAVKASESTNELISWTARTLANNTATDDGATDGSTDVSLLKVKDGCYYFIASNLYQYRNVVWSIVQVRAGSISRPHHPTAPSPSAPPPRRPAAPPPRRLIVPSTNHCPIRLCRLMPSGATRSTPRPWRSPNARLAFMV